MPDGSDAEYLAYVRGRTQALRRVAYLLCGDGHQADDLVQETITKLYAKWPRLRVDNLDAYVHTMLVRTFLDDRRRGWWKVRLFGAAAAEPEPAGAPGEDRTVLRAALAQVPPRQQAVLVLRFLCDQPVADVARILGCSEGTVKSQTSHGLNALRKILGPSFTPGPSTPGPPSMGSPSAGPPSAGSPSAGPPSSGSSSLGPRSTEGGRPPVSAGGAR